jgi:chromate transport protein ChrA
MGKKRVSIIFLVSFFLFFFYPHPFFHILFLFIVLFLVLSLLRGAVVESGIVPQKLEGVRRRGGEEERTQE